MIEHSKEGGQYLLIGSDQSKNMGDKLCTYDFLENADQRKFGSVEKGLVSQKILENDQFPKIIANAHGVLSNHDHYHKKEFELVRKKKCGKKQKWR